MATFDVFSIAFDRYNEKSTSNKWTTSQHHIISFDQQTMCRNECSEAFENNCVFARNYLCFLNETINTETRILLYECVAVVSGPIAQSKL